MKKINLFIIISLYIILHQSDIPHVQGQWGNQSLQPIAHGSYFVLRADVMNNTDYPDSVRNYLRTLPTQEIADSEFVTKGLEP